MISTLERWIKDLGDADSSQQLKVRKQMQQLIKEIGKLN
jgi:hypothetical protein